MNKMALCLPVLLSATFAVQAQDGSGCPQLPAGADLVWEYRSSNNTDFCRALRVDGSEAFGVYIAKDPPFEPKRSNSEALSWSPSPTPRRARRCWNWPMDGPRTSGCRHVQASSSTTRSDWPASCTSVRPTGSSPGSNRDGRAA